MRRKEDRMHVARITTQEGHSQKDIAALLEDDPYIDLVLASERLQRRGYTGGMTNLRDCARKNRKRTTTRAVRRFESEPGRQAQMDWKACGRSNISGEMMEQYAFAVVLGHSLKPFVLFATDMKLSTVGKRLSDSRRRRVHIGGVESNRFSSHRRYPIEAVRMSSPVCRSTQPPHPAGIVGRTPTTPLRAHRFEGAAKTLVDCRNRFDDAEYRLSALFPLLVDPPACITVDLLPQRNQSRLFRIRWLSGSIRLT